MAGQKVGRKIQPEARTPESLRNKRTLHKKLGPWTLLCVLVRYQNGESSRQLAREFGVSSQTIIRMQRSFGHDTRFMHKAMATHITEHELQEARLAFHELKRHVDRGCAVLDNIMRRHKVSDAFEQIYPKG